MLFQQNVENNFPVNQKCQLIWNVDVTSMFELKKEVSLKLLP